MSDAIEKTKYVVVPEYDSPKAVAVDWNQFPPDIFSRIPGEYIYNVLAVNKAGKVSEKTVIYIKPVKKFRKSVTIYDLDEIQIGV